MKSDGIQRSVRAKRHDRTAGDAPNIGRVARMPGTGIPKRERRRRRHREGRRWVIRSRSILLGVAALLALVGAFYFWMKGAAEEGMQASAKEKMIPEAEVRVKAKFPSPSEAQALALVKRGLAIREPANVASCFRPGASSPEQIVEFLMKSPEREGALGRMEWLGSIDSNGLSIDGVLIHFNGKEKISERLALLTPDDAGIWKIDFDALARTNTPSWVELLEQKADQGIVRVFIAEDAYYNGAFDDETRWVCNAMATPDDERTILGYCKVGSPQVQALKSIYQRQQKISRANAEISRATVEIRRVPGASAKQFEITSIVAEDWVVGEKRFDEGFK